MTIKTPMFQMVELIIPATITGMNAFTYFQQQPQLQSMTNNQTVYVRAIETFSVDTLTTSPLTTGSPVATNANIQNATLVLNIAGTLKFQNIPLGILNRNILSNPAVFDLFQLKNIFEVDWTKSYVTTVGVPIDAPFSYLFGVHYSYSPDENFM
jgi:hypothetical protein